MMQINFAFINQEVEPINNRTRAQPHNNKFFVNPGGKNRKKERRMYEELKLFFYGFAYFRFLSSNAIKNLRKYSTVFLKTTCK